MAPTLGYWKLRGLGQSIRLVLEYSGDEYVEKFYEFGPPPALDKSCWTSVKYTLGLQLPNLPYYIDGDIKLTQSYAIIRHLGRKYDLCGQTEKAKMTTDMLMDQGRDMRVAFVHLCYHDYSPEAVKNHLQKLQSTLKLLSDILGDQTWFTGDKITLADFVLYDELDINLALDTTCIDGFQNLKRFLKRFEQLPAIKKFMASPRFLKWPIVGPSAKFGGS